MAKRLTTQDKIKRARAEGYSRKQLAKAFGVSVSAVGRAERGDNKRDTLKAQADQFYKLGKRAKSSVVSGQASLPSARPPAPPKSKKAEKVKAPEPILSPVEKFESKLNKFFDNDKIVIYVNVKGTGRSITLGAHGGIKLSTILAAPSVGDFLAAQGGDQGYKIDWDNVASIIPEEYY